MRLKISKRGGISYLELKTLDIHEFFVMLINYEKELNEKIKNGN